MRLKIRHNMEMAHRLLNDNGKCQNIHGHGMQVELVLLVAEGPEGMAVNSASEVLEFGKLKKAFRNFIDTNYDHRLVLNQADPWAGPIFMMKEVSTYATEKELVEGTGPEQVIQAKLTNEQKFLPGLTTVMGDPTVENMAKWIAEWACEEFRCDVICRIDETRTNGAEAMYHWNGFNTKFMEGAR